MMARSPSRNMPIASALTAKPFTDGSVVARSRADSSRLAPSASGSSPPTTPQQESALESHHEHTIEMLFSHLKRILKLARDRKTVEKGKSVTVTGNLGGSRRLQKK